MKEITHSAIENLIRIIGLAFFLYFIPSISMGGQCPDGGPKYLDSELETSKIHFNDKLFEEIHTWIKTQFEWEAINEQTPADDPSFPFMVVCPCKPEETNCMSKYKVPTYSSQSLRLFVMKAPDNRFVTVDIGIRSDFDLRGTKSSIIGGKVTYKYADEDTTKVFRYLGALDHENDYDLVLKAR